MEGKYFFLRIEAGKREFFAILYPQLPVVVYFTLADASQAPDTKVRISGDRERDMTSPVWPV